MQARVAQFDKMFGKAQSEVSRMRAECRDAAVRESKARDDAQRAEARHAKRVKEWELERMAPAGQPAENREQIAIWLAGAGSALAEVRIRKGCVRQSGQHRARRWNHAWQALPPTLQTQVQWIQLSKDHTPVTLFGTTLRVALLHELPAEVLERAFAQKSCS